MIVAGRWGAVCAAAVASIAQAQAPAAVRQTYDAAFFQQFAPSTARQIVDRIPGFSFDRGDSDVRGFGQAAGNVVINGQRPSSKADSLETVLARIPANRVLRVEVGPGDLFGSEFAGKPQVANIVLVATGGLSATTEASILRDYTGAVLPQGNASLLLKRGGSTFNVSAGFENDNTTEEGTDTVRALPSRSVTEFRRKINTVRDPEAYVSAAWAHDSGANRTAHLNGRFETEHFKITQANHVVPTGGPERDDALTQRYRRDSYEIGGDVIRPLAGGGLKLIGLATRRDRVNRDVSLNRIAGSVLGGFAQTLDDRREERVLRLVWNRTDLAGWSIETGGEAAWNKLDSVVDLEAIAAGGTRSPIDLPVDDAVVKERRAELFVNAGRALSSALRIDGGLTYETSRLTVAGDATAERSLSFLKPKASLDWRPGGGWHVQLSAARTVAQLQFEDFISAAELTTDRVNGGNPDLVPQRSWDLLATVERPILGDGLVKLQVGRDRISLLQDRVPTPEGFDAPGNLGTGTRTRAEATVEAPLGRVGIKGGRLTFSGRISDTAVRDPYTGRDRDFSGEQDWNFNVGFRQDLGSFAWGVNYYDNSGQTFFRRNELDLNVNSGPYMTAFIEYRPRASTTIQLFLDNLLDTQGTRTRTFFAPSRANPAPNAEEYRERNRHVVPSLTIKHNFG
jgi:hypothetical protein